MASTKITSSGVHHFAIRPSKKPSAELTRDELIAFYEGRIAKWWTPDDVIFVDAIPLGATGKMLKNRLRDQYGKHLLAQG